MALNINPINTDALARLAGNTVPDYHLPLHAITGGDFFTSMADQNNKNRQLNVDQQNANTDQSYKASTAATEAAKIPILQQDANNQTQHMGIDQQNANTMAGYKDQAGQELKMKGQALQADMQQRQADAQLNQKQGAIAATLVAFDQINKDPTLSPADKMTKMEQAKKTSLDTAYAAGTIKKDEYTQGLSTPAPVLQQHLQQEFIANKVAQDQNSKTGQSFDPMNPTANTASVGKQTSAMANAAAQSNLQQQINNTSDPVQKQALQTQLDNIHTPTPTEKALNEVAVSTLKQTGKEALAAKTDQINVNVLKTLNDDPNVESGSLAAGTLAGKKVVAAIGGLLGVKYDPNTAPSEAYADAFTRAQIDFVKMLGQRVNQTEWTAAGQAVPKLTNTDQGRRLMTGILDYNNASKTAYNDFSVQYLKTNHDLAGVDNAWDNYMSSLGFPYNPQTKQFDGGDLIRNGDPTKFINDSRYQKPGVVHLAPRTAQQNAGNYGNQSQGQSQYQEGRTYQDQHGNKAIYTNGHFQETQ